MIEGWMIWVVGFFLLVGLIFWSVSKGAERQMEYHYEMKERWNK